MSTGKVCRSCGNMWEAGFRFCPADGLPLPDELHPLPAAGVEADSGRDSARRGSGRLVDIPPVQSPTGALPRATPRPGPGAIAGPRTKRSKQVRPEDATLTDVGVVRPELVRDPTLLDRQAIAPRAPEPAEAKPPRAPAEAKPSRAPAEAKPSRAPAEAKAPKPESATGPTKSPTTGPTSRKIARAPTVVTPVAPDTGPMERVAEGKAPAPSDDAKQPRKRGFSETAWFMRVVDSKAVDPNTGRVKVEDSDYQADASVPEEKRRLFSLGSKDRKRGKNEES